MNYNTILLETLNLLFYLGALVAIVLGFILLVTPHTLSRWNTKLNKWYSTRRPMKPLEIMRETESYFFKHHRFWGWLLCLASILCLYLVAFHFPTGAMINPKGMVPWQVIFLDITLSFLKAFIFIFVLGGIPLWILLIVNPQQVQKISTYFNRWISTRLMILPLEKMHTGVDDFVIHHAKPFGIGFIIGGILILLGL
jgi:hypothetical protein